ncbi:MAG: type II secretion system protein [Deltaproteobacteria bacterium]|nr:type II secretion system protein [Deltaproteobacteria bacterium]
MKRHLQKGFSLVETVLVIVVMAIIFTVTAELMIRSLTAYSLVTSRQDTLERAGLVMDRMIREIRLLGILSLQGPLSSTQITFRDSVGVVTNFSLNGTTLSRGNDLLASGIASLNFGYLDKNGNVTQSLPKVRRISIQITVSPNNNQGDPLILRSEVFPRNFSYASFQ